MAKKEKGNKRKLISFNGDIFVDQHTDIKKISDETGFKMSQLFRMGADLVIKQFKK